MDIDILYDDPAWEMTALEPLAAAAFRASFAALDLPADRFVISVLACDDARIALLNGVVVRGGMSVLNKTFSAINDETDPNHPPPTTPLRAWRRCGPSSRARP